MNEAHHGDTRSTNVPSLAGQSSYPPSLAPALKTPVDGQHKTPITMTQTSMRKVMMGQVEMNTQSPKKKSTVPGDLIPCKRSNITLAWAQQMWSFANHLDKSLPKKNPGKQDLDAYIDIMLSMSDFTSNRVHDRLLEYLQSLCRVHSVVSTEFKSQSAKSIESIHAAVLSSASEFNEEYLKLVLKFIKLPQHHEVEWLNNAVNDVMEQYDIQFAWGQKNFVIKIANQRFNNCFNQRLHRGMERLGSVWYDRLPSEEKRRTLFGNDSTES